MRARQMFLMCVLSASAFVLFLTVGLGAILHMSELSASAQSNYIPATTAFQAPAACSDVLLGGLDVNIDLGLESLPSNTSQARIEGIPSGRPSLSTVTSHSISNPPPSWRGSSRRSRPIKHRAINRHPKLPKRTCGGPTTPTTLRLK